MADSNFRPDSVNVEHIMQQIRARIRDARGVEYTEQQIRDLAAEAFGRLLDPQGVRPGLLEQFRQGRVPPIENYSFEDTTLFESHRAPLRWTRRLLRPVLKLFFNPNPLIRVLHLQSGINARHAESTATLCELLYNLVLEMTRLSVEVKTLKMRVESIATRVDFAQRRERMLEGRAQRRSEDTAGAPSARARGSHGPAAPSQSAKGPAGPAVPSPAGRDAEQGAGADARRRKRRRRGRRGGATRPTGEAGEAGQVDTDAGADSGGDDTPPPADRESQ